MVQCKSSGAGPFLLYRRQHEVHTRYGAALLDAYIRDRTVIEETTIERVVVDFATDISD